MENDPTSVTIVHDYSGSTNPHASASQVYSVEEVRRIVLGKSLYHCTICEKNYSCDTYILKHVDSACHKNNISKNILKNDNKKSACKNEKKITFQKQ